MIRIFFFSSRRRHTISTRDWSSDVCSSDLVGQLMETLDLVRATLNPRLELLGMLMTMYDARTRLSTQVVEEVRSHFPTRTFETVIPRSVRLSEAPSFGKPVLEYEPTSRGAGAYADLAQEVLRRGILR